MNNMGAAFAKTLLPVVGVRLGTGSAGIKELGKRDLVVIEISEGAHVAAVFTRNAFCAAPVQLAKQHLKRRVPRYCLINTGNANAGTGQQGMHDARQCCEALSEKLACRVDEVLPFSTGVIGELLPTAKIVEGLQSAIDALSESGWDDASYGIMTTDTRPKALSLRVDIEGTPVTVTGIAKGAGMIMPNMATMLAYIATDASIEPGLLQQCLSEIVEDSFNRITVDGDTSTNDACVLIATGENGMAPVLTQDDARYLVLKAALSKLAEGLAQAIVRDGEGATKFITIEVEGGRSQSECRQIAMTVANSPLVKTAFFAGDPNWGRILMAVGRAGVADLDVDGVSIFLDEVCIVESGARASGYREEMGQSVMARHEITVRINLNRGAERDKVWTCDFSYDYVKINAEYRT